MKITNLKYRHPSPLTNQNSPENLYESSTITHFSFTVCFLYCSCIVTIGFSFFCFGFSQIPIAFVTFNERFVQYFVLGVHKGTYALTKCIQAAITLY